MIGSSLVPHAPSMRKHGKIAEICRILVHFNSEARIGIVNQSNFKGSALIEVNRGKTVDGNQCLVAGSTFSQPPQGLLEWQVVILKTPGSLFIT